MLSWLINVLLIVFGAISLLIVEHYVHKKLLCSKQWQYWQVFIFKAFHRPVRLLIVFISLISVVQILDVFKTDWTFINFDTAKLIVFISALIWGTLSFIKRIEKYFLKQNSLSDKNDKERKRSTIILLMKLCFATTSVVGTLILLHTLGVRMQAVITVISLSGVTIGIASRDLITGLFGTIFIYTNAPFAIGDRIKLGNIEGTVENITWLSTRVRLDNTSLILIPNIQFLTASVENISYALDIRTTLLITIFHYDFQNVIPLFDDITTQVQNISGNSPKKSLVSAELVIANDNKSTTKIKAYFDKQLPKAEVVKKKIEIALYISHRLNAQGLCFDMRFDE